MAQQRLTLMKKEYKAIKLLAITGWHKLENKAKNELVFVM